MPTDNFEDQSISLDAPIVKWADVTPSNSTDLAEVPRAIACTSSGTVAVVDKNGTEVSLQLNAGDILPIRPHRIKSTGTSATGIVALY